MEINLYEIKENIYFFRYGLHKELFLKFVFTRDSIGRNIGTYTFNKLEFVHMETKQI